MTTAFVTALGLTLVTLWLVVGQRTSIRAEASIRYVAPDGDDSSLCDSIAGRCRTVQRAIDVAQPFDEIRVATGVYTDPAGRVATIEKTVTLLGGWDHSFTTRDPSMYPTTLDAQRNGRVVYITGNISPTLDGFVITGGNAHDESRMWWFGGGVLIRDASPIISNNVITDNIAYEGTTPWGRGGGIYVMYGGPGTLISGNRILSNTACTSDYGIGGGVALWDCAVTVRGNEIRHNVAGRSGGGIYLHGSSGAILAENLIVSNTASLNPTVWGMGGGVYVEYCDPITLTNNVVAQNYAKGAGGLYIFGYGSSPSSAELTNNTFADNNVGPGREGIWINDAVTLTLTNNIIVGHTVGIVGSSPGIVDARYTLFYGNDEDLKPYGTVTNTHAVIGNPLFVDPTDWDYHLRWGSAAMDAGDPVGVPPAPPIDVDGDPRPVGARVDIGADEYLGRRVYLPIVLKDLAP